MKNGATEAHLKRAAALQAAGRFSDAAFYLLMASGDSVQNVTVQLRQCQIQSTYSATLSKWPQLRVKYVDDTVGAVVVTTAAIAKGSLIFYESPILSVPTLEASGAQCDYCISRVLRAEDAALPQTLVRHARHWPSDGNRVRCTCGTIFCSEECRLAATALYHTVECPIVADIRRLREWCRANRFSDEEDHGDAVLLVLRIYTSILCQYQTTDHTLEECLQPYAQLVFPKYDDAVVRFFQPLVTQLRRLLLPEKAAVMDPSLRSLFDADTFAAFLGKVVCNSTQVYASPFHQFVQNLTAASLPLKERQAVLETVTDELALRMDALRSSGTALFNLHHFLNHSCLPNAQVVCNFGRESNNHSIAVVALRSLQPGEEIRISYLTKEQMAWPARAANLARFWHFVCNCPLCTHDRSKNEAPKGTAKSQALHTQRDFRTSVSCATNYSTTVARSHFPRVLTPLAMAESMP
eukprot:TRINITY_DN28668_c0_g1_i2.p1 TRINITY_DN28668_c0_g1~~TRINITY_DN28668_c0_g1_i2.p1  ORF type:complete len:473 (+),score=60.34 TRINITY_DN28668_c0_g1_i2:24-1421(+)